MGIHRNDTCLFVAPTHTAQMIWQYMCREVAITGHILELCLLWLWFFEDKKWLLVFCLCSRFWFIMHFDSSLKDSWNNIAKQHQTFYVHHSMDRTSWLCVSRKYWQWHLELILVTDCLGPWNSGWCPKLSMVVALGNESLGEVIRLGWGHRGRAPVIVLVCS